MKINYKILRTKQEIIDLASYLLNFDTLSFDTETTGLDTHAEGTEPVGLGFSVKEGEAYYVPINCPDHGMTIEEVLGLFKDVLESPSIGKIGQNLKYDARICNRYDINLAPIKFDTFVASYCLYSDRTPHGLDHQALQHFGIVKTRTKHVIPKKKIRVDYIPTMKDAPIETVGNYCMEDVDMSFRLYKHLAKLLELPENSFAKKLFYQIELPLLPVLIDMECNGVEIDSTFLDKFKQTITKKIERYQTFINKKLGYELSITKTADIAKALYEELKLDEEMGVNIKVTKTGKKSTDAGSLDKLKSNIVVRALLSLKKYEKMMNTYITGLPEHLGYDGRIHTSFNQCSTATGRLSSSGPNLQNIPSKDEQGKIIRRIFVSRWKSIGGKILAADYSQAELRILAHISQEPTLISVYNRIVKPGEKTPDVHDDVMDKINAVLKQIGSKLQIDRRGTKTLNFGMIYGMGSAKLGLSLGIDKKEAGKIINAYFQGMPNVKKWIDETQAHLVRTGYTETMFGRRRYIPKVYALDGLKAISEQDQDLVKKAQLDVFAAKREGPNHVVQGGNGDIIKLAMIAVYKEIKQKGLKSLLVLQVHDELVLDVYPGEEDTLLKLVTENMQKVACLCVPMNVGAQIGLSWADAH